jgi:hypothetical protein
VLDNWGSSTCTDTRFSVPRSVQTGSGALSASCATSTGILKWGQTRPGRETGHSNASSVEVKNVQCTATVLYVCAALRTRTSKYFTLLP